MTDRTRRRVMRLAAAFVLTAASTTAATLFPQPLHLVRTIEEPIGRTTITIEEFCAGNRIVSVRGERVSILDLPDALTEIDRTSATWSRTPLAALAAARRASASAPHPLTIHAAGARQSPSGAMFELFEATDANGGIGRRIEVAVDRRVSLSREAVEALIGASYPGTHTDVDDVILAASADRRATAASAVSAETTYGLPAEVVVTVTVDGETLTTRSTIVSVDRRNVPAELLIIPSGSTRVESRAVRFEKEADALDHPAGVHR